MSSDSDIAFERNLYIGNALGSILYGAQLVLCFQSVYFLSQKSEERRSNMLLITFSLFLAVFVAIGFSTNIIFGQKVWIDDRNVLGGPPAYIAANSNVWYTVFGSAAQATGILMGDTLLFLRLCIFMRSRWVVVPALVFITTIAVGIVASVRMANPLVFTIQGGPKSFAISWMSITVALSVSFNALVTLMISIKLLHAQKALRSVTSPDQCPTVYTGIIVILVESALPYTISGIVFSVFYGRNNFAAISSAAVWAGLAGVSPQLIILRVSMGIAYSNRPTSNAITTDIEFNSSWASQR